MRVFFECSVAVEVIGREIQEHANLRAEFINRFQLEAADLRDGHDRVRRPFHQRKQRRADIAAYQRGNVRRLQNVREQRGGGGLSIRASDGDQLSAQITPGQFDFAPHWNALRAREFERPEFCRNARAHDD